jgi:CheY-like chemotaxis protein
MIPMIEELQGEGHEVVFEANVDEALALLTDRTQMFDLVVLDISIPPGRSFQSGHTDGGSRTGLLFYEELRHLRPTLKVVVFTNVADRQVAEYFAAKDQTFCRFIRKPEVLPFQFVTKIEDFFKDQSKNRDLK